MGAPHGGFVPDAGVTALTVRRHFEPKVFG
jgi:hypothetical protein